MLSTMHNISATTVLKCPKGCHEKRPIPYPTIIDDYNQYMGGVDLTDQNLSYYSMTNKKTLKWWKKVFWRFIDICIINSWIIFRHNNPQSPIKTQQVFRLKLIEELVQQLLDLKASTNCPPYLCSRVSVSTEKRLIGKHFAYKNTKQGRCRVCSQKKNGKKDTKTQNYCQKCGIFLCIGQCFEDFHTKSSY